MLQKTANHRDSQGQNRGAWMLSPQGGGCSEEQLALLQFLGQLLAMSVFSRNYLGLCLAPPVWATLARSFSASTAEAELEQVDQVASNS